MPTIDSITAFAGRFHAKVDRSAGPEACWPWMGYRDRDGYGRVKVDGRPLGAHRVALLMATGGNVAGPAVCTIHSCDNPACCNPKHLRAASHAENVADRDRKGRGPRGARNGRWKPELHPC